MDRPHRIFIAHTVHFEEHIPKMVELLFPYFKPTMCVDPIKNDLSLSDLTNIVKKNNLDVFYIKDLSLFRADYTTRNNTLLSSKNISIRGITSMMSEYIILTTVSTFGAKSNSPYHLTNKSPSSLLYDSDFVLVVNEKGDINVVKDRYDYYKGVLNDENLNYSNIKGILREDSINSLLDE